MGCDIHCYIEYKQPKADNWSYFGGRINPGRDYLAFGHLAGVRSDEEPVVGPRGFPDNAAYMSKANNYLMVVDYESDESGLTTREKAEQWVSLGLSRWVYNDGVRCVTHPDHHTHSWLTLSEWKEALKRIGDCEIEYYAITAAMEELSRRGADVRIVFWFDN